MKKLLIASLLWLLVTNTAYCAVTKSNIYNSKNQRVGYYKTTYKSNGSISTIDRHDKTGRRVERVKVKSR